MALPANAQRLFGPYIPQGVSFTDLSARERRVILTRAMFDRDIMAVVRAVGMMLRRSEAQRDDPAATRKLRNDYRWISRRVENAVV